MVTTKRKVETEQDRYGGFATRTDDFLSPNKTYEPYQPSFNFNTSETNSTSVDEDFEVEKEYKFGDYSSTCKVNEETPIKSFMPLVQRKKEEKIEDEFETSHKLQFNARGKILICAYSLIAVILIAFAVYNAIAISKLNSTIATKNADFLLAQQEIEVLETQYSNLGSSTTVRSSIGNTFELADNGKYVSLELGEKYEVVNIEENSNLFDKICNFLSSLI